MKHTLVQQTVLTVCHVAWKGTHFLHVQLSFASGSNGVHHSKINAIKLRLVVVNFWVKEMRIITIFISSNSTYNFYK